jgi:nicotinamide-nucleotide amidase
MPCAEILSQGDEVVTGQITDTNAAWLATELTELGFTVTRHVTVGDRCDDISASMQRAALRADLVVCSGGLGPTDDDLTAQAASLAFDTPLKRDEEALHTIRDMYARFGRDMPASNEKQAWLPQGSVRLDNPHGTAPGFAIRTSRPGIVACMPGVPREMKHMFRDRVVPLARDAFRLRQPHLITIRTTGVGESTLQERIGHFEHDSVVLSYRTTLGENQVKLRAPAAYSRDRLIHLAEAIAHKIGRPVFSIDGLQAEGGSLPVTVARLLTHRRETLACAESCTGGLVSSLCTSVSGSSAWFMEGVVAYANEAKQRRLHVDPATLHAHGAVSSAVALEMAVGIREHANTTFGLATTGIAGPGGGSDAKPVGTVHIALSTPESSHHRVLQLGGSRQRIQHLAAHAALNMLRLHLQEHLTS